MRVISRISVLFLQLSQLQFQLMDLGLIVQQTLGREARERTEYGQVWDIAHEVGHPVVAPGTVIISGLGFLCVGVHDAEPDAEKNMARFVIRVIEFGEIG
jgi:hypothetical protein